MKIDFQGRLWYTSTRDIIKHQQLSRLLYHNLVGGFTASKLGSHACIILEHRLNESVYDSSNMLGAGAPFNRLSPTGSSAFL